MESSSRTVRRRLGKVGLHGRVARKKPLLTLSHKQVPLSLIFLDQMGECTLGEGQEKSFYLSVLTKL